MSDRIILKNLKIFGFHGVYEEERVNGQDFFIDVELEANLKKAVISDKLEDTVDYTVIYDIIKFVNGSGPFNLIEKFAGMIGMEILDKFPVVLSVTVRVRKPGAVIIGQFDSMEVVIETRRNT